MIPDLLRHQLAAMVRRAVIATAAKAHFSHDFTGRATRQAANDKAALRDRIGLPPGS